MNKVVQDYILLQSVGKGQYGNVYRAQNRKTKQIFAVKVMSIDKFKHTPKLSEFTNNQINILTKISHPNIIKFVEMLRTNNNYYLVYQYCNGGTLSDYIKSKKRLTEDEALRIFAQLRSAFETLAKNQILHRDLKPTNIIFHNGVVKVADFGFCKEMLNNQLTQTMVGSPIYMAPEVLKGSVYDNRADVWSLGVILYEMLYGFCPYQECSIINLIGLIDNTVLKFPSEVTISSSTKKLLQKMMAVKYRSRMTAAQLVAYSLQLKDSPQTFGKGLPLYSFEDVKVSYRKWIMYIAQTLDFLVSKMDKDEKYVNICFLIYKIYLAIQKQMYKSSAYWEILRVQNNIAEWDPAVKHEIQQIAPLAHILRDIIMAAGPTLPMKLELQTHFVDLKFYIHLLCDFISDPQARLRLINCLLIYRHFILVEQKKIIDFNDYVETKKSVDQKQEMCKRFAYTRA